MSPEKCLLCYQNCPGGSSKTSDFPLTALISQQLYAVFILRKILEVPVETLEEYLEETTLNPSEWITVCEDCKGIVEKARRIYKEVLEAQRRFRKVKGDIIQFVRRNKKKRQSEGIRTSARRELRVTKETRRFVNENNYSTSLVDPFIGGDCEAEKLLYSSNVVGDVEVESSHPLQMKTVKIEIEEDDEVDDNEEDYVDVTLEDGGDLEETYEEDPPDSPPSPPPKKKARSVEDREEEEDDGGEHKNEGRWENSEGELRWHCTCGKMYTDVKNISRHIREVCMDQTLERKFACTFCKTRFKRRWDLTQHLLKKHPDGEEENEENQKEQINHENQGTSLNSLGETIWNCSCGRTFTIIKNMNRHLREMSMDPKFACPVCDKRFKRKYDVKQHISKHHGDQEEGLSQNDGNLEEEVNVEVSNEPQLHEENGTSENTDGDILWHCTCGRSYSGPERLKRHIREATMDKKEMHACPVRGCGKRFKRGWDVKRHLERHHKGHEVVKKGQRRFKPIEVRKYREEGNCTSSLTPGGTGEHRKNKESSKMADGTQYWTCSCGKIYLSEKSLEQHVQENGRNEVEGTSSKIICEVCDLEFKRRIERNVHMRKVHGITSNQSEGQQSAVEVDETGGDDDEEEEDDDYESGEEDDQEEDHEKLGKKLDENGVESWHCSCGKSYQTQTSLHRHWKEMKMDESYLKPCPYCEKKFKRQGQVRRHVATVHEKSGVGCDTCGKRFNTLVKLKEHQKRNTCSASVSTTQEEMETEEEETQEVESASNLDCD